MAKKKIDKSNLPTIVETGNNPLAYKDEFATVRQPFNQAQLELLSTMANLQSEADLIELK